MRLLCVVGCGGGGSLGDGGFAVDCERLTMRGGGLCDNTKTFRVAPCAQPAVKAVKVLERY